MNVTKHSLGIYSIYFVLVLFFIEICISVFLDSFIAISLKMDPGSIFASSILKGSTRRLDDIYSSRMYELRKYTTFDRKDPTEIDLKCKILNLPLLVKK